MYRFIIQAPLCDTHLRERERMCRFIRRITHHATCTELVVLIEQAVRCSPVLLLVVSSSSTLGTIPPEEMLRPHQRHGLYVRKSLEVHHCRRLILVKAGKNNNKDLADQSVLGTGMKQKYDVTVPQSLKTRWHRQKTSEASPRVGQKAAHRSVSTGSLQQPY